MNLLRRAVTVLSLCTLALAVQGAERFVSATAGLSLEKSAGWTFVSVRPSGDVTAEELQAALAQGQKVPLVSMRYEGRPFPSTGEVTLLRSRKFWRTHRRDRFSSRSSSLY